MIACRKWPRLALAPLIAATAFSVGISAAAPVAIAADEGATLEANGDLVPGADREAMRPPATFFTINEVLAKLDRQRGRGPGALRLASLTPSNVATDASPAPKAAPAVGTEPFGLFTFRAPEGVLWRKWRGVESDITKEQAVLDRCRTDAGSCPPYAAQFLRLINAVKAQSGRGQLEEANRAVNVAIRYVSDFAQHGEADRWSAPLASFATGKGDCEDYAIAKYVALTEAGFPREELRLVLVRDRAVRQDHAVLAAHLDGRWLILDSRRSDLMDDADATSFTPLYAINHRGVQLFAAPLAKRDVMADEIEASPAAAGTDGAGEWTGQDGSSGSTLSYGSLPLLM
jgi:predicted transglutaminase-like cysteine proteinase